MSRMINGRLYASTQEAADVLSINTRTMLQWLRQGAVDLKHGSYKGKNTKTIPLQVYVHPISGYYFVLREQLDTLVALLNQDA